MPSGNLNATTSGNAIGLPKRMRAPLPDMFSTMQSMPALSNTTWARFSRSFRPSHRLSPWASAAAGSSPTVMLTATSGSRSAIGPGSFLARGYPAKG